MCVRKEGRKVCLHECQKEKKNTWFTLIISSNVPTVNKQTWSHYYSIHCSSSKEWNMYHISCLHNADWTHGNKSSVLCVCVCQQQTWHIQSERLIKASAVLQGSVFVSTFISPAHAFCGPAGIPALLGSACPCRIASLLSFPSRHSSERFSRFHYLLVAEPTCMDKKQTHLVTGLEQAVWESITITAAHVMYKAGA